MVALNWVQKTYKDLTKDELYNILKLRVEVFVVEQECPYPEVDGRDKECTHIWLEENGKLFAYCRIVPPETEEDYYAIGRVIVIKEKRGQGYAKELMERAITFLRDEWKAEQVWLHGQEYLRGFYGSFGFREVTDVYLEDNIPHVDMLLEFD